MSLLSLCDCCGERQAAAEALANGHQYCEGCSIDTDPRCECGRPADPSTYDTPVYWWSDRTGLRCAECLARAEYRAWADQMRARLKAAAAAGGWTIVHVSYAETGSEYYTLHRPAAADDDDEADDEEIVVRISDHESAYCREDYSLTPSGLEFDADAVLARIASGGVTAE